jgi:hypothetical protein
MGSIIQYLYGHYYTVFVWAVLYSSCIFNNAESLPTKYKNWLKRIWKIYVFQPFTPIFTTDA